MAVKIRLQRKGRKKQPYYQIVIADARSPRDGKFIERLGFYNPMTKPATIEIDRDKAYDWLQKGAQPTDTVRAILKFKGVMYKKHLMRGVKKGVLTQEAADAKWNEWLTTKDARVAQRFEQTKAEKEAFHKAVSGEEKKIVAPAPVVEEEAPVAEAAEETAAVATEETPEAQVAEETTEATTEAPAEPQVGETTETPAEEPAAPVAEEAPAAEETAPADEPAGEEEKEA